MRFLLLPLLCLVSIATQAEEWKKSYQVAGKPDIFIAAGTNPDIDVKVVAGAMNIDIDVRAWDNATVEAKVVTEGLPVKKIHINENQKGDRIELRVVPPHVSLSTHTRSVRVELMVPHQSDLEVKSDSGHVIVDQVNGKVQIAPGSTTKSFVVTTTNGGPHIERQ